MASVKGKVKIRRKTVEKQKNPATIKIKALKRK